jgi:D-3-phosphoglycerate dehydrogenase
MFFEQVNRIRSGTKTENGKNVADVLSGYYPTYLVNKDVKDKVNLKNKE